MAFHEVRFPEQISYGAVGGPMFKTTVLELKSGHEKRNVDWSLARGEWDVAHGVKTQVQLDELLAFFYARNGRAHGFRFKDWSDYRIATIQTIGLGDDARTQFQVFKAYASAEVFYDRPLTKLVDGTVGVYLDGQLQATGYTVDVDAGVITFDVAPTSTLGTGPEGEMVVGVTCEFDVPVRFDSDHMQSRIETLNIHSWNQILLKEIRA